MTNAEKFEEVFGMNIDNFEKDHSLRICNLVDRRKICTGHRCNNCRLKNFWNKLYRNKKVTNQSNTGYWIYSPKHKGTERLICSKCGKPNHCKPKPYCFECGSKNTDIIKS